MKNFLLIIIFFFIVNCSLNKVIKHHGVHFLEKKQSTIILNKTYKNDVVKLLGPPSTSSVFDTDLWIYIERNTSSSKLSKLGKKTLLTNNVLLLEFNKTGLLTQKIFLDKDDMENIKFSKDLTTLSVTKKSFVYEFLSGLRQKINDPLGKKKIK
tara:strand:- start:56 stop:517 length:462 start_codon:yes stop_codon:yes gene_type:complete